MGQDFLGIQYKGIYPVVSLVQTGDKCPRCLVHFYIVCIYYENQTSLHGHIVLYSIPVEIVLERYSLPWPDQKNKYMYEVCKVKSRTDINTLLHGHQWYSFFGTQNIVLIVLIMALILEGKQVYSEKKKNPICNCFRSNQMP